MGPDKRDAVLQFEMELDHHDLARRPPYGPSTDSVESDTALPWGLRAIRSRVVGTCIDSDQLYTPEQTRRYISALLRRRIDCSIETLRSGHGHDAFLIEWDQLDVIMRAALEGHTI